MEGHAEAILDSRKTAKPSRADRSPLFNQSSWFAPQSVVMTDRRHEMVFMIINKWHDSRYPPPGLRPQRRRVSQGAPVDPAATISPYSDFKTSRPCRILELPPELRSVIFQMALSQDSGEVCVNMKPAPLTVRDVKGSFQAPPATRHAFALTETCKKIHVECGDMVYHFNTFTFRTKILTERPAHWNFNSVLAKQVRTGFLKAVQIHLGAKDNLSAGTVSDTWAMAQLPLRRLRKQVATFQVAFTLVLDSGQFECVFGIASVDDAVRDLRRFWNSLPHNVRHSGGHVTPLDGYPKLLRIFFPFWTGMSIL